MSDSISTLAAKLRPHWLRDLSSNITAVSAASTPGVTDHGALTGLLDDDHPQYLTNARGDVRYIAATRLLTAGAGLTGGGDLSADRTFTVGAGSGITVNADDISLTTPGTLTVSSTNSSTGSHTHAITSSSSPGAAASILASSAAGLLTLYNGAFTQAASSAATFASGFAGSGWRADYGITTASRASIECDDLTVRGRMRVYELLIQQIRATNGSLLVTSSSKVVTTSTSTNPLWTVNGSQLTLNGSNATLTFTLYTITTSTSAEDAASKRTYHGFLTGDIIRAQQVEWDGSEFGGVIQSNLEVTSVANLYTYSAAYVSGDAPAIGYDYVRLGNSSDSSRRGVVYLTSDDSAAPFIDIVDSISYHADWNSAGKIKARLGKLTGISDSDFGGALSGYGLYSTNVYLKGNIYATSGQFSGTVYASAGSFTGTVTAASGTIGGWSIGASALTAGSGSTTVGLDSGGTNPALYAGSDTPASAPFRVTNAGALTATSGSIGGWTLGATALTAGSGSTTVGLDSGGSNPALYAGSATPASAPFRVTNAGALTATGATISGAITATSGSVTGNFYAGSSNLRLSTDGQRFVLQNTSNIDIPTNSSALRWFAGIDDTWTNSSNYVGLVAYRHTGITAVDGVFTVVVGDTDDGNYDARAVLQAGHYASGVYTDSNLIVTREKSTGARTVNANCDTFNASSNVYVTSNCSALSFTDRTPFYEGDAVAELKNIKGKTKGGKKEIDHSTLPAFARKRVLQYQSKEEIEERDLGAMISMLTRAVQQLDERLSIVEA